MPDAPPTERRKDLDPFPPDPPHNAVAAALQIYGGHEPGHARSLARRVLHVAARAGIRADGMPTNAEVRRVRAALHRHGFDVDHDAAYDALFDALFDEGHP
jgi:hypothetical protein